MFATIRNYKAAKKLSINLLLLFILLFFYIVLYKIYMPKVNAFGCFDDCFNFVAGYFINKGKVLYSEIFFNHQMLMAYISTIIQSTFHPINIYDLVLRHRQFVFFFGFLFNIIIILRFGFTGFSFALFYEFTKFYLFGDRFLAEGLIVYPLVYMTGLIWNKLNNKKIYSVEFLFAAICTWFVIFMREPFAPLALFIYMIIISDKNNLKIKILSLTILITLTIYIFTFTPINDFLFNVFSVNSNMFINNQVITLSQIFKAFFYPFYLFVDGDWNIFRYYIIILDSVFIISILLIVSQGKSKKLPVILLLILGVSNIRATNPGKIFYEGFHMLPWYGIFLIVLFLMVKKVNIRNIIFGKIFYCLLIISLIYIVISPNSFTHDKINPQEEFLTNYGNYLQVGETVKALSKPKDSFFVDGFDELIYWQADRYSSFKYSWYTSVMPFIPRYSEARLEMLINNPPDFYYGSCPKDTNSFRQMPNDVKKLYTQLYSEGKPRCLYVKKTKIPNITDSQWLKAKEFLYELPPNWQ